jgi:tetratricopeptide (TPR) repeat protein
LPAAAGPTCLAVSEGTVYAGYYSKGVFASADDGRTWQALNAGWSPQIENVNLLAAGSGQLTAYVLDRGALTPAFWRLPLSGGSSAEGQESPRIYFQNGQRAYRDKDFRNAVLLFTKAIEKDPRFVDAYLQRAWADLGLGGKAGFESAAADAAKVIELDPSRKEVHFARGKAYMGEASLAPSANRRAEFMALIDKALADYQIALDADPGSVVIQIDMGQAHFAKGDLDRALAAFSSVYEKKREEPGLEPSLKALFGEFERRKRSIDCGNAVQTWVLAGQFYHDRGRYDETIRCYSRAIDLGLTGRSIFMSRGSVYGRLGDFAHAIADADMDIKLNADEFSYGFRGQIREKMGDLDKAIQDLSEAIRIRSKKEGRDQVFKYSTGSMPDLLITRARLYGEKGAWGQAVEDLLDADKRLLSGPPKAEVEKQLADAYRSKGDTKNAEKFLKKAQALKTGLK